MTEKTTISAAPSVGRYRFTRAVDSPSGFLSQNRPSTDAINALERWKAAGHRRKFEVKIDEEEELVAVLSFDTTDMDAGGQLDAACYDCGVSRHFIE